MYRHCVLPSCTLRPPPPLLVPLHRVRKYLHKIFGGHTAVPRAQSLIFPWCARARALPLPHALRKSIYAVRFRQSVPVPPYPSITSFSFLRDFIPHFSRSPFAAVRCRRRRRRMYNKRQHIHTHIYIYTQGEKVNGLHPIVVVLVVICITCLRALIASFEDV